MSQFDAQEIIFDLQETDRIELAGAALESLTREVACRIVKNWIESVVTEAIEAQR